MPSERNAFAVNDDFESERAEVAIRNKNKEYVIRLIFAQMQAMVCIHIMLLCIRIYVLLDTKCFMVHINSTAHEKYIFNCNNYYVITTLSLILIYS